MNEGRISRSNVRDHLGAAPIFVLDHPQMGENIGASARAMLNFGVSALRLVRPRDGWPNPRAAATASGASLVVDGARVFDSLDAAIGDCQFVLATTARRREVNLPVLEPRAAARALRARVAAGERCAVLFGGERNGLETEDVACANAIISVPVNPAFASLNLAQAVLIVAYEWAQAGAAAEVRDPMAEERAASMDDVARLYVHLESELDARGYFFPPQMREVMTRNLRVALTRAGFTEGEVRTLRGVIKTLARAESD